MVRPTGSIEGEPVMSEKVIPIFDGTGEAYWWLIQLDRYFKINSWIRENMKVDWVTVFALKGEAYRWWSSWKQGCDVTWETFERGFIKKFIPDLWEMLEAAEGEEQENHEYDEESMEIGNKSDSTLMQNSSEQSDQKLPATTTVIPSVAEFTAQQNSECHKELVIESYVFLETEASGKMKIKRLEEATTMVEAVDTPPPSGSPAKVLPKLKPPDLPELPPKLPDNGPFVVSLLRPPVHSSESSTAIKLVDEGKQDPEEVDNW
jgi:hypothetical protein